MAEKAPNWQKELLDLGFKLLQRRLGTGSSSAVRECVHVSTGARYAAKIIDLRHMRMRGVQDLTKLKREVLIMERLRHQHIVRFERVFELSDTLVLIMELLEGQARSFAPRTACLLIRLLRGSLRPACCAQTNPSVPKRTKPAPPAFIMRFLRSSSRSYSLTAACPRPSAAR